MVAQARRSCLPLPGALRYAGDRADQLLRVRAHAMKSLYLAGFDVFREDALDWGKQLKAPCAEYGFEGLYPLDKQVPAGLHGPEAARWIYDANIALIRQADMVMANLDDFRGPGEPDSGTAFEVGFAVALQKPVWGHFRDAGTICERAGAETDEEGCTRDVMAISSRISACPRT
ncbi:nucleoside 2-deoxyribosyltransferase [Cupriavidus basilensis]